MDAPAQNGDLERFVVHRKIGEGGMGMVFEAYDRDRNVVVALKTLRQIDGAALYRFKTEFRSLAGIQHPNLVRLYELLSSGDSWFFTMELIDNIGFRRYVRPIITADGREEVGAAGEEDDASEELTSTITASMPVRPRSSTAPGRLDEARLRGALAQLAEAVSALHRAGKLHRDIKPSNILVTAEGRVALADFGLVVDADRGRDGTVEGRVAGTPAYMAPEQASGGRVTEASDWYSLGVVLYEALCGVPPYPRSGAATGRLALVPPSEIDASTPPDLEALCLDLLQPEPKARPTDRDVLSRLGMAPAEPKVVETPAPFLGRESELGRLRRAQRDSRDRAVVVGVSGQSGIGKSALLRHFLDGAADEALVLEGRCYVQESMPYKGVDAVIDACTRHLIRLHFDEVAAMVPRHIAPLARLFPVLRRVEAIAIPATVQLGPLDPVESRRRAFEALRELVGRLAKRRPLILVIDDAQWGDIDSAGLLEELVRPPDAPRLLLVVAYRSEDRTTSPFLRQFLSSEIERVDIELGALSPDHARGLMRTMLPEDEQVSPMVHDVILRDAGGNPFLLIALGHYLRDHRNDLSSRAVLTDMLRARFAELPDLAQQCFAAIAVAGRRIRLAVLVHAVGDDLHDTMQLLRSRHLVRTSGVRAEDEVEAYHDRLRELVVAGLRPDELRGWHARLAKALERTGDPDREALAMHLLATGQHERAARHAVAAAEQAAQALAFDRAARLYRLALELDPPEGRELSRLQAALGEALAHAGYGADAAHAFLSAARDADAAQALEYRRRAAEQYLRSGHVDDGIATVREVLSALGMKLPASPHRALAIVLWHRLWIRLRGVSFVARDPAQVSAESVQRIDTCHSVAAYVGLIDPLKGMAFQCRHLIESLRGGEPARAAKAIAMEGMYRACGRGPRDRRSALRLSERACELAETTGDPTARAFVVGCAGMARYQQGEFAQAFELAERSCELFRDRCTGVAWEIDSMAMMATWSLYYLGEVGELARRVPVLIREARSRGDLFAETSLSTGLPNLAWLCRGDVAGARRAADDGIARWSRIGLHIQHYWHWLAHGQVDLYAGDAAASRRAAEGPRIDSALLMRVTSLRVEASELRGRLLLASAVAKPGDGHALRVAARLARRLGGEIRPWPHGLAALLAAGIARVRGDQEGAVELYGRADELLTSSAMALHAAVARRRRGELLGGSEGARLVAEADAWIRARGMVAPSRIAALLAPAGEPKL